MTPDNVHQPPEVFRPGFVLWRGVGAVGGRPPTVGSRPIASALVLLFTWLFSKPQAVSKYVQLYTRRGYDVLQISSKLSHFLWPPNSKAFAVETFGVLRQQFSEYEHYIVHGMSIGAYNYTSCIMLANKRPDLYYGHFTGKLRACVMDSLTIGSLDHMVNGIATGASQRTLVRRAIQCTASVYFGLTHNTTVEAFNEGVDFFKQHPAQVPTLVFACRNDPMSDADSLETMVKDWKVMDRFPVTFQLWERSGHCAHLQQHTEEYVQLLDTFLASLNLNTKDSAENRGAPTRKSKL